MLKKLFVLTVALFGLAITGLVVYAYLFLETGQDYSVRGETAIKSDALILRTSRGVFIDKTVELNPDIVAPFPGYRAPDFELYDLDGNLVRLSDFLGKPVLLNFWATWCPPCRKEIPDLQAFHEQYGDSVVLLGINWSEEAEDIKAFLAKYDANYPNLIDEGGKFFVLYQLTGLPTSHWIDEEGMIRGIWLGAMSVDDMVAGFEKTTSSLDK